MDNNSHSRKKPIAKIGIALGILVVLSALFVPIATTLCKPVSAPTIENETTGMIEDVVIPTEPETTPTIDKTIPPVDETSSLIATELPHEHEYTATVRGATCDNPEITVYVCECEDTYQDKTAEALGHNYKKRQ